MCDLRAIITGPPGVRTPVVVKVETNEPETVRPGMRLSLFAPDCVGAPVLRP